MTFNISTTGLPTTSKSSIEIVNKYKMVKPGQHDATYIDRHSYLYSANKSNESLGALYESS